LFIINDLHLSCLDYFPYNFGITTEISQEEKPETFQKSKEIAKRGGKVAGDARRSTEKELGRSIISDKNNLDFGQNKLELEE